MDREEDRLIDALLHRALGGRTPPDLVGKVVARAYPRRPRWLWWAAGAAAILLVAILLMVLGRGSYPRPQVGGRTLARGTWLTTGEKAGPLTLGGYCHIQIKAGSKLRIEGAERAEAIFLAAGGVVCDVDRRVGSFAVKTRTCTVSATGTLFTVRILEAEARERVFVSVQAGAVRVADALGNGETLEAGHELTWPAETTLPKEEPKKADLPFHPGDRVTLIGIGKALASSVGGERDPAAANATLTVTATGLDGRETEAVYDVRGWAGVILAKAGDGKKAEVSGVFSEKDGKRTITGKSVDVKIIIVEEKK